MRIGETTKVTEEPTPRRMPLFVLERKPEREPVPVRSVPQREKEPLKTFPEERLIPVRQIGNQLVELPYSCLQCGRELEDSDGMLTCPVHGLVLDYGALR